MPVQLAKGAVEVATLALKLTGSPATEVVEGVERWVAVGAAVLESLKAIEPMSAAAAVARHAPAVPFASSGGETARPSGR